MSTTSSDTDSVLYIKMSSNDQKTNTADKVEDKTTVEQTVTKSCRGCSCKHDHKEKKETTDETFNVRFQVASDSIEFIGKPPPPSLKSLTNSPRTPPRSR